jgi:flagellar biosynthesis/type III secretory pathway protein FliH
MEVVVLNLGDADKKNNREILNLLNVLFSPITPPDDKKKILEDDFNIAMTAEFESEVQRMCNLSKGVYNEGVQQGIQQGMQQGIQQGIQQGERLFAQLLTKLYSLGRAGDAERAASDEEYRNKLMEEFQITR